MKRQGGPEQADASRETHEAWRSRLSFSEKLRQMIFPDGGECVSAMPSSLSAARHDDRLAARHTLNFLLENSQLWRVNQVILEIDRQQGSLDPHQPRRGVVIYRAF